MKEEPKGVSEINFEITNLYENTGEFNFNEQPSLEKIQYQQYKRKFLENNEESYFKNSGNLNEMKEDHRIFLKKKKESEDQFNNVNKDLSRKRKVKKKNRSKSKVKKSTKGKKKKNTKKEKKTRQEIGEGLSQLKISGISEELKNTSFLSKSLMIHSLESPDTHQVLTKKSNNREKKFNKIQKSQETRAVVIKRRSFYEKNSDISRDSNQSSEYSREDDISKPSHISIGSNSQVSYREGSLPYDDRIYYDNLNSEENSFQEIHESNQSNNVKVSH